MTQSTVTKKPSVAPRRVGRPVQTRGFPRVQLRLPPDLYEKVVASAARGYASLNSEIIRRLRATYGEGTRTDAMRERLDGLDQALEAAAAARRGDPPEMGWADDLRAQIDATKADADAMRKLLDLVVQTVLDRAQKAAAVQQGKTAAEPADGTKAEAGQRLKSRNRTPGGRANE